MTTEKLRDDIADMREWLDGDDSTVIQGKAGSKEKVLTMLCWGQKVILACLDKLLKEEI